MVLSSTLEDALVCWYVIQNRSIMHCMLVSRRMKEIKEQEAMEY